MSAQQGLPAASSVSDEPLNGYITALHLVQNGRTNEKLIVGGSDDGSLAFWSFEYASFLLNLSTL